MPSTKQAPKDRYENQRRKSAGTFNRQAVSELMKEDRNYAKQEYDTREIGDMKTADDKNKALKNR